MITVNVTVIYGNPEQNNTYDYTNFLLNNLRRHIPIKLTEYFLPEDSYIPCGNFCERIVSSCSYFNCCNESKISKSICDSDLIILACSSIKHHMIPPSLKILLDHLSYIWMPHKINIPMSQKIGLVISDDYVPILHSASKTLKKHMKFWGIRNIFNFNFHNTSETSSKQDSLSRDYLNLVILSVKITNLISSDTSLSYLKYKKVIKFPYSNLIANKNTYTIKNQKNKVIPIKKIQNN
ncbi:hypothetical protein [uncultured Clostridium sp.]|uniref:hypothetical protein n=1 Tax=uncultured Clostridium sp. TaxID=59620 RepID=UPI0025DAB954|nr:hypothetical protein [uncultured Clostridium sp.]